MKNKLFKSGFCEKLKLLLIPIGLLIGSINTAWGWSGIKLRGDWMGGFSYQSDTWTYGGEGNKYWDVYHPGGTKYWRLHLDYFNHDVGPNTANYVLNVGTAGYKVVNTGDKAFKTTANAGILRIQSNQTTGGGEDEKPYVWITRPTVKFKYDFENDGGEWTMVDATDNQDGTYTYRGLYCGTNYFNAGPNDADKVHLDGDTPIGSPSAGDRCEFKWQPGTGDPNTDYKYTSDESHNYGIFTITKLCSVTYNANNPTSGTAPANQEFLYGTDNNLQTNSGNLEKTGYVFNGWNTATDGSGDHYDEGATIENVTAGMTLYAEWSDATWGIKGGEGDKDEGAGADHDALGNWITFNQLKKEGSTAIYSAKITLPARHTYCFKVFNRAGDDYYGYGSSGYQITFIGQTGYFNIYNGTQENLRLMTAGAGEYEFVWDSENKKVKVLFPEVNHPSMDYVYFTNPSNWATVVAHLWGGASSTGWQNLPSLYSFGTTYYYTPVGNSTNGLFGNNPKEPSEQTSNFATSGNYGKSYNGSSWSAFSVTINLDNQGADVGYEGTTSRAVSLGYEVLTSTNISTPNKTGYNFGGYYTETGGNGLQIIDANGAWQTNKTGYTDASGNWIKDGMTNTLYAKWTEKKWDVTAQVSPAGTGFASPSSAESYGQIEGGEIAASNNTGYHFTTWSITSGDGTFESAETTANNTFYPTANTTLTATFAANTYTINLNYRGATGSTSPSSVTATYNSNSLSTAPVPTKWGNTFGGWEDEDGILVIDEDGALIDDVKNYTDGDGNWVRDEDNIDLYAVWTPKEHLYWISGDGSEVLSSTEFTATETPGVYYVTVDMSKGDKFHLGDGASVAGPTETDYTFITTLGGSYLGTNTNDFVYSTSAVNAKQTFVFTLDLNYIIDSKIRLEASHLVVYFRGGKSGDSHKAVGSVESFDGTIYGESEFRLSVREDEWSTLYLPFNPTDVKIWDQEDTRYYDVVPYERPGGKGTPLYYGDYIIRTPSKTTELPVNEFEDWNDPTNYSTFKPAANTPYIIMWHDWRDNSTYFNGKYVSFFANEDVEIPEDLTPGVAPTEDNVLNIYGNPSLAPGSVENAYTLVREEEVDVWKRPENEEDPAVVPPFGCYVLATQQTEIPVAGCALRRLLESTEVATGWEDVLNSEYKVQVTVYTINGYQIAQFENCSFNDVARKLSSVQNDGIYILRAEGESVKLILNGK